jgi:protein phosphatase
MAEQAPNPWESVGLTDRGLLRTENQDCFAVRNQLGLWIVADGTGGHGGGETASRLAVDTIVTEVESEHEPDASPLFVTFSVHRNDRATLQRAILAAHDKIRAAGAQQPALAGMATTVVALYMNQVSPHEATLAHVGDSRAYRLRKRELTRLTEDHTWAEEQISGGRLSREQALAHPSRNMLTRSVGSTERLTPEVATIRVEPGDLFLLSSDGLHKMLSDEEIRALLLTESPSLEAICRMLLAKSNERGGKDNATVVLARVR